MAKKKEMGPEEYMQLAVEVMKKSMQEKRNDTKISPLVGAVLVKPDGEVVTAYRSELREGDHAEFTVIERKCRDQNLEGSTLYATLEPCAPGARHYPKLSCSERIVNARIKKVYVGIEDPDPTVARKGIVYLQTQGVEVEMFKKEYQEVIEEANAAFLRQAEARARAVHEGPKEIILSSIEKGVETVTFDALDEGMLRDYMQQIGVKEDIRSGFAIQTMVEAGILALNDKGVAYPTGIGILLFGKNPQLTYPNAKVCATLLLKNGEEYIKDITGPLLKQPEQVEEWLKVVLGGKIDRSHAKHETTYDYPLEVLRELMNNAILHRDYAIQEAAIQLRVTEDSIVIMSPGGPVSPIRLEQLQNFSAPTLSRNPKIISVFNLYDISEQRGFGFRTVRELPTVYKKPLPLVSYEAPYLVTTIGKDYSAATGDVVLKERERRVLEFVRLHGPVSRQQCQDALELPERTANRILRHLVDVGYVESDGQTHNAIYFVRPKE